MNETSTFPSDDDIHAYVDGLLDEAERARMRAWLARNPDRAKEVHGWQRDAQQLRAEFGGSPSTPARPDLDPAAIRARQGQRARTRLALAAMLVLSLGVGSVGGWQARSWTAPVAAAPMADALQAYRMYAVGAHAQLDIRQRQPGDLQKWLDQYFHHATQLPNLGDAGFYPVGGRLIATDSGPAAMVLYEDRQGGAISFYIRPPSASAGTLARGQRREGQLATTYWSGNGYNYALVSRANTAAWRIIRNASAASNI